MKSWFMARSALQRWLLYYALAATPGALIFGLFSFKVVIVYEILAYLPQQRFFDFLKLSETIPLPKFLQTS